MHRFSIPLHSKFARRHKPLPAQIPGIAQHFVARKSHHSGFVDLPITKRGFPSSHD
jgi:hypothetical protein